MTKAAMVTMGVVLVFTHTAVAFNFSDQANSTIFNAKIAP